MINRSLREWSYINIGEGGGDELIPRAAADSLVASARASRVGGEDGEAILINGHKRLRAQQVVGVLASPAATLEILPKVDSLDTGATRNWLVHMLARVYDLDIASGAMVDLGWQKYDILEILIKLFCGRLFEALHRGLPRRYVTRSDDLPVLRGRLDVKRQFTTLIASPQKLACQYEDLSPDIALNQIMKAAVCRLLNIARAPENQRQLAELSFAFADITTVPVATLPWGQVVLDRTNRSWAGLLNLAKLLLGDRFQTTSGGDGRGFSLMFEMNTLFEEFVGRTMQRMLVGTDLNVRLQGPRDYALVADDMTRRFATRPDIAIYQGFDPIRIVDTKWKRLKGASDDAKAGVGQADIYQMMAYAQIYQCKNVMLLYPHHDEIGADEGVLSSHRISGIEDTRVFVASVRLSDVLSIGVRLDQLLKEAIPAAMYVSS